MAAGGKRPRKRARALKKMEIKPRMREASIIDQRAWGSRSGQSATMLKGGGSDIRTDDTAHEAEVDESDGANDI